MRRRRAPPDSNARSLAPLLPGACRAIEACHGSAGAPRALGGWGVLGSFVTLGRGAPGVSVYDAMGRAGVELGLMRDGEPRMVLLDARGGTAWKAP